MSGKKEKLNKRSGVLICGAYGMSNAGDEAILQALVAQVRSIDADMPITVLSRTPEQTAERHGVESLHMFDLRGFLRVMRRSALYINGGGSLIQDVTSTRSLWYYLYTIFAAKRRGCKVLMYGCGIGPVSRAFNRRLTGLVLDRYVDAITLREENSLQELESFGVKRPEIEVASDPALTLSGATDAEVEAKMRALGLDPAEDYVCFCLRNWEGFKGKAECFAKAADYVYEKRGLRPLFLAVNLKSDGSAASEAAGYMKAPYVIVAEPMSTDMTVGFISRMRAVVSIRLHGLIFAASQGVPVAGVVYDPKVSAFLDYIGESNYVQLSELDEAGLCAMIDRALDSDRAELAANVQRLRDIESRNVRAAKRLLGKG